MSRSRTRTAVAGAVLGAVVLAACASSKSTTGAASSAAATTTAAPASSAAATTAAATTTAAPTTTAAATTTAAPAPAKKSLRIGFLPPLLGVPAFQGLKQGLEGMGGGQFGDKVLAEDAGGDPAKQLQIIQSWVKLGQIDALWVIPTAGPVIAPAIKEATDKGIVVVAGGKPTDFGLSGPQPGITFSDIDNVAFGKGVGDLMAKCVTARMGGKANLIYIGPSSPNESTTNINEQSAKALAAGAAGTKIVQSLVAKQDFAANQQQIASALQGNPDANAIMAGDAESTLAGLNAFTAAGKDATKLCVVGNGGQDDQKAAIKEGKLFGVVAFDFVGDLAQNLNTLHAMAADPKAAGKQLTVPISIIDK